MTFDPNGIRQAMYDASPPWLQDGIAEKYVYVCGLQADAVLDKCLLGVLNRFPLVCDPTALPILGAEYGIPQGPSETNDNYRQRLHHAWTDYQHAGMNRAVMRQGLGYLSPLTPQMRIVKNAVIASVQSSVWDTYAAGADTTQAPTNVVQSSLAWDWDGLVKKWRIWWIIYSVSGSPWSIEGTWGDGDTWGDTTKCWGVATPATTFSALRAILAKWRSAGDWYMPGGGIIVSFDATLFSPTSPGDAGVNPDGNWAHFGRDVAGTMIAARYFNNVAYADGA